MGPGRQRRAHRRRARGAPGAADPQGRRRPAADYKEIDLLHRQLERQARVQRYQDGGTETDLNPNLAKRNAGPKKKPTRNEFSEEQIEKLIEAFRDGCFDYQQDWYRAGNQRTRAILKSRQIGATYYFAREALIDALTTGRNQIFLSAVKAQAHIFKAYISRLRPRGAGASSCTRRSDHSGRTAPSCISSAPTRARPRAITAISTSTNSSGPSSSTS